MKLHTNHTESTHLIKKATSWTSLVKTLTRPRGFISKNTWAYLKVGGQLTIARANKNQKWIRGPTFHKTVGNLNYSPINLLLVVQNDCFGPGGPCTANMKMKDDCVCTSLEKRQRPDWRYLLSLCSSDGHVLHTVLLHGALRGCPGGAEGVVCHLRGHQVSRPRHAS